MVQIFTMMNTYGKASYQQSNRFDNYSVYFKSTNPDSNLIDANKNIDEVFIQALKIIDSIKKKEIMD